MTDFYKPTGQLEGDKSPMPSKGTGTAVKDTYGADIGGDSTNSMGSFDAKSDSWSQDMPEKTA